MRSFVLYFLGITPIVVESVIITALLVRKLHSEYRWFLTYLIFDAIVSAVLLAIIHHTDVYIWCYWISEAVSACLQFLVIAEVYRNLLLRYPAVQRLGTLLFRWGFVGLLSLAVLSALQAPSAADSRFAAVVLSLEESTRIVQLGMLLSLFLFSSLLGLNWKQEAVGIAIGFTLNVVTDLAAVAMRNYVGPSLHAAFMVLKPAAFNCAVLVWAVYLLPARRSATEIRLPNLKLRDWDRALAELMAS